MYVHILWRLTSRLATTTLARTQMPHLWSVLTGLAGPRGLYCERMAKVVLVILLYTSYEGL